MFPLPRHRVVSSHKQAGAALIVALLLLLVMTILGVTAMNSSILQGLMSASYQQQTVTLADAENILLQGEFDVEELVLNGVGARSEGATAYYFDLHADPSAQFPASTLDVAWPNPFVIEYMGEFEIPGESVVEGGGFEDSLVHIFRVSARRQLTENERGGQRIVQSLYVTLRSPNE